MRATKPTAGRARDTAETSRKASRDGRGRSDAEAPLFLGARLMTLANLMRRIMTLRFQRLFRLSLVDGWVVSRLGTGAPMSLDQLAYLSGLAKSQMSRSVTSMVRRRLVSRTRNPRNKSEVVLRLTPAGQTIYEEFMRQSPHYNRLLTTGFDDREVQRLTEFVGRLIANSRRNLSDEQQNGGEDDE